MAGGYTHLTLVRSTVTDVSNKYDSLSAPHQRLVSILDKWLRFAYLGAVSPDYPYFAHDADIADLMHKGKTNKMIATAIRIIHQEFNSQSGSVATHKAERMAAWLAGFVAHVVADVVVHPVVNICVGKYEDNKNEHRQCELNQDVYIYKMVTGIDLSYSDNMKSEIRGCGTSIDLDDDIESLWKDCLDSNYDSIDIGNDQIDAWHSLFIKLVDFAESGRKIPVIGRHLAGSGNAYPNLGELDQKFLELSVPITDEVDVNEQPIGRGSKINFETVFNKAKTHIIEAWGVIAEDLFSGPTAGSRNEYVFGNWSLDTGIDNDSGKLRLWPFEKNL